MTDAFTDRTLKRQYLVELRPVDDAGVALKIRVANRAFTTEPSDDPPNARFFNLVSAGPIWTRGIEDDEGQLGGLIDATNGGVAIQLHDGNWDWAALNYVGHPVEIRMGLWDAAWADHRPIFGGTMGQPQIRDRQLIVPLFGAIRRLDKQFQDKTFGGGGGWDGGADHAGKPLPALYGWGFNVEPLIVDAVARSGVFHDRSAQAVDTGYSGGNSAGATFTADLARGRVTPAYLTQPFAFTIDARGDAAGGFVDSHAKVIERIILQRSAIGAAGIDADAFQAAHDLYPDRMGYFVDANPRALDEVIDDIARSGGLWVTEGFDGRITCIPVAEPAGEPDLVIDQTDMVRGRLDLVGQFEPVREVRVDYAPNWRRMTRTELAGVVHDTGRETFLANTFRTVAAGDADVLHIYPEAVAADPVPTYYIDEAAGRAHAARLFAIRRKPRRLFQCTVHTQPLERKIGDGVFVTHADHNLQAGALFVIRYMQPRLFSDEVTLRFWG